MYKKLLIIIILILPVSLFSQNRDHELGAFGGVAYYMGDLNQQKLFYSVKPAFGFLYKFNINSRYALRFSGSFASLSGSDSDSKNGYQLTRNHSFDIPLTEFAAMFEFNFFPFIPESRYDFISPYVAMGLGVMIMPTEDNKIPVHPVIPFGVGVKYSINKRLSISGEWAYRKTFTDYIDQLPDDVYTQDATYENKQRSYSGAKDWYSFAGISLTYKFALGSSKCPAYRN